MNIIVNISTHSPLFCSNLLHRSAPAKIAVTVLLSSSPFSLIIINPFVLIWPVLTETTLDPFTLSENRKGADGTAAKATDSWSSLNSVFMELLSVADADSNSKTASSASSTSSFDFDVVINEEKRLEMRW